MLLLSFQYSIGWIKIQLSPPISIRKKMVKLTYLVKKIVGKKILRVVKKITRTQPPVLIFTWAIFSFFPIINTRPSKETKVHLAFFSGCYIKKHTQDAALHLQCIKIRYGHYTVHSIFFPDVHISQCWTQSQGHLRGNSPFVS